MFAGTTWHMVCLLLSCGEGDACGASESHAAAPMTRKVAHASEAHVTTPRGGGVSIVKLISFAMERARAQEFAVLALGSYVLPVGRLSCWRHLAGICVSPHQALTVGFDQRGEPRER